MDKFSSGIRNYNPIKYLEIDITGQVEGNGTVILDSDKIKMLNGNRAVLTIDTALGEGSSGTGTTDFVQNGYNLTSDGLLVQWGANTSNYQSPILFPIAFPNQCFAVVATQNIERVWSYGNEIYTHSFTPTEFTLDISGHDGGPQYRRCTWIAVGH